MTAPFSNIIPYLHHSPPSADKLLMKADRTMVACAPAGALANLAEAGIMRTKWRQGLAARGSDGFAG
jgi:hypothetical protein